MPTQFRRRYELLLPTNFNDGSPVPRKLTGQTLRKLRRKFDSFSAETHPIDGQWEHAGEVHRDLNVRVFVDVPDTPANRKFFVDYKEKLKTEGTLPANRNLDDDVFGGGNLTVG